MARIVLSEDHLRAEAILGAGERIGAQALMQLLQSTGVTYGVLPQRVAELAALEGPARLCVAEGLAAQDGCDGRIEAAFSAAEPPRAGRGTGMLQAPSRLVSPGDVIARRVPPVPPRAGRTVLGRLLQPSFPADVLLRAGNGAEVGPDGTEVLATIHGRPYMDGSLFVVRPEVLLQAGPHARLGMHDVQGDLRVNGEVGPEATLRASGHIVIEGDVNGARLIAGGDIWVLGTVKHGATLEAIGNISARALQGAAVRSKGTVRVGQDVTESDVVALDEVLVGGSVIGGKLQAGARSEVRAIGADGRIPTQVLIIPPTHGEQYAALEAEQAKLLATMRRLAQNIRQAEETAAAPDAPESAQEALGKLRDLAVLLERRDDALSERKKALGEPRSSKRARVDVREHAYAEVRLQLGETAGKLQQEYPAGSFIAENGSLRFIALSARPAG